MLGYAGKFLEVDLSNSSFKNTTLPEEWLRNIWVAERLQPKS